MKLMLLTAVEFDGAVPPLGEAQLDDLTAHVTEEVGSKLLHIIIRDDVKSPSFIASINTDAMLVGEHSEAMVIDNDCPPFYRADGGVGCVRCHKPLREHPAHSKFPELTVLCGGQAVKL